MKNKLTNYFLTIFLLSSSILLSENKPYESMYSSLQKRVEKLEEASKNDADKKRSFTKDKEEFIKDQDKTIDELREQIKNLESKDQIIPSFINSTLIAGVGMCSFVFGIIISQYFSTKS